MMIKKIKEGLSWFLELSNSDPVLMVLYPALLIGFSALIVLLSIAIISTLGWYSIILFSVIGLIVYGLCNIDELEEWCEDDDE